MGWGDPGGVGVIRGRLGFVGFPVIDESHLHNVAKFNLGYFWPFLMIIGNGYYLVISPSCSYSFKLVLFVNLSNLLVLHAVDMILTKALIQFLSYAFILK